MFRVDYHQRASSGAFLGGSGRGNAATLPRAPLCVRRNSQSDVESACVEDARTLRASRRYLYGDPDNVIAFAMVWCCAYAIIRQASNLSPWEPESAKARSRWWRARSLGPS